MTGNNNKAQRFSVVEGMSVYLLWNSSKRKCQFHK